MVKLIKMIFFFNQYLSFIFRIGLTLGYYHPVYSVSSGIYKKGKKFMDTVYYQRSSLQNILSLIFLVTMELALGHYNPVYSVSSGIYKKTYIIFMDIR